MKVLRKHWWLVMAAVLLALCGSAAAFIVTRPPSIPDCQQSAPDQFTCWQARYQRMVAQQSPKAALDDIKKADQQVPYVHTNCHQISHVIGRASGQKYGDVTKAYDEGDNFCWSGYYHGVMEAIATKMGAQNVVAQINTICESAKQKNQYGFYHFNCVHGLGHGLMAVQGNQLFTALESCGKLDGQWQQESCYGGAFMENVMSEINPDHKTTFLKDDDPMYPCTAVGDRYKQQCYLMQTSHALKLVGYDFGKGFDLCDAVAAPYNITCYQSLGRDASGFSSSDQAKTIERCMLGKTLAARDNCFVGAVKDFLSYFHSDTQGMQMCNAIPDKTLAASCQATAIEYYKSF